MRPTTTVRSYAAVMTTPPGWYPDPWSQSPLRYWDGADWTAHVSGPPAGFPGAAADHQSLRSVSVWLRRFLIVEPLIALLSLASTLSVVSGYREYWHQIQDDVGTADPSLVQPHGFAQIGQIFGVVAIAGVVLRIVWMVQAGKRAAGRGRPLRRSATLAAFGWIIPIVSLWWPYQAMTDALGSERAKARHVGLWWLCYLVATIGTVVALVAGIFSTATGWMIGLVTIAAHCGVSALEYRIVDEALDPAGSLA
jgi:hypothetical protein